MKYDKVIEVGDSLKVPVSVSYSAGDYFFFISKKGMIRIYDSNNNDDDTFLVHLPQLDELGQQELSLVVYANSDSLQETLRDTFYVNYEVVTPIIKLENNYSIRIGDTLLIPLEANLSGEEISIESNIGTVVNDSLFQYLSNGSDEGVHEVAFTCTFSNGASKLYSTSLHVLPFHSLKIGDEWSYIKRIFTQIYTGKKSCSGTVENVKITNIKDGLDSLIITFQTSILAYEFTQVEWISADSITKDTVKFEEKTNFESTAILKKNQADVFTVYGEHLKALVVENYQFRVFNIDSTSDATGNGIYKESFKREDEAHPSGLGPVYSYYKRFNYNPTTIKKSFIPGVGMISQNERYTFSDVGGEEISLNMIIFNGVKIVDDSLDIDELLEYLK